MISATLPFTEGNPRRARANKIQVCTDYSSDGRSCEVVYVDYDPMEPYSLFLLEHVLNTAEAVQSYRVYDADGSPVGDFRKERFPKRV